MEIKVTIEVTTDYGAKMLGVAGIVEPDPSSYISEVDNIIIQLKKAMIACGYTESQVDQAFEESGEI